MVTEVQFLDRDWSGQPQFKSSTNFTSNINNATPWTCIQVGGLNNTYPTIKLVTLGEATSPASLGSNPADRAIYLEVKYVPRGEDNTGSGVTMKFPLLKWKSGETTTQKEITTPIESFLNTDGQTDGNIFIRLVANTAITFTNVDMFVAAYGTNKSNFASEATTSTTNNIYNTDSNGRANSVEEIPSSTAGYVEFTATEFGYFGDIKLGNKIGLNRSGDVGTDPRYYWEYSEGDGTGNTAQADAWHDGVSIASGVTFDEGDVFRVERNAGGTFTYKKNGVSQGTGGTTDTVAMKGEVKLTTTYSRALGLRMDIGAGAISPTFENKVNVVEY